MSSLEVLSAAGLRCKLRSHDQGARVTTTKRRKSTLVSLSRSCQPGLERTRGLPRHSLHAFVALARAGKIIETFSVTLGTTEEHNPYTAELAAIARGLKYLPEMTYRVIMILTSNRSVAQAIGNPRQQSGQGHIREIYDAIEKLKRDGNRVRLIWLPFDSELEIQRIAKMSARHATEPYVTPRRGTSKAKTTILSRTRANLRRERELPDGVGRHSRKVDSALPGKHTRLLYDQLPWKEASVLA
jgi:ribonuclease HI